MQTRHVCMPTLRKMPISMNELNTAYERWVETIHRVSG